MVSRNSGAGVDTIIFAIKTVLYNAESNQKVLTPRIFGRIMKGWQLYDKRNTLKRGEVIAYKNQLMNAYDFWGERDTDWQVRKEQGNSFKLIFTKEDE